MQEHESSEGSSVVMETTCLWPPAHKIKTVDRPTGKHSPRTLLGQQTVSGELPTSVIDLKRLTTLYTARSLDPSSPPDGQDVSYYFLIETNILAEGSFVYPSKPLTTRLSRCESNDIGSDVLAFGNREWSSPSTSGISVRISEKRLRRAAALVCFGQSNVPDSLA